MTPLERAAAAVRDKALWTKGACGWGDDMEGPGTIGVDGWVSPEAIVRAVLTAIREPDEAMTEAGGEQVLDTEVGAGQYASIADGRGSKLMANNQAVNAWTAMIDALLSDSPPT